MGQPLEVTKTTMAANRGDSFAKALARIWGRGGVLGCMLLSPSNHGLPFSGRFAYMRASVQSTKVLSPGPGSKHPPKAQSSSSSPPKVNTMRAHSALVTSRPASLVASWVAWHKRTLQWVSAPA